LAETESGATHEVTDAKPRVRVVAIVVVAAVALVAFASDQLSKVLITQNLSVGERIPVLGEILQFHFVKNSGAAFSLASGSTWFFSIVAAGVAVLIMWYSRKIHSLGWAALFGMLLGGTLGNLADRLFREPSFGLGHVVDFIQMWGFPAIFNIADSFIVASMGLFIILTIRGIRLDGSRAPKLKKGAATAESHTATRDPDSPAPATTPASGQQSEL